MSPVSRIYELQSKLNTIVHPEWILQGYDFQRAIMVELCELADQLGYKWWKKHVLDEDQVKLEVVDIFHFFVSDDIIKLQRMDNPEIGREYLEGTYEETGHALTVVDKLVARAALKEFSTEDMIRLIKVVGMDVKDCCSLYLAKNVLNAFRQANGYKDGSYKKLWDGKEDNVRMMELFKTTPISGNFEESFYKVLSDYYATC